MGGQDAECDSGCAGEGEPRRNPCVGAPMNAGHSSGRIVWRCYLGMFIQAMVINVTPLLFLPLRNEFELSFEQIGRLILVNFLTQMLVDLLCTAFADRLHLRALIVAANALSALGLWIFAGAPYLLANPYAGLMLGTVVFSVGCGLLEVLLSPLIHALPAVNKSGAMALLHAFYPILMVPVILAMERKRGASGH